MITRQRLNMVRNLLTMCVLVTMLNSRTLAGGEWNLRLLVLPCQSYGGDEGNDAAARVTVALSKAFEEVETISHGETCKVIRQRDVDSAARRLGLPVPDKEGDPVAWNVGMVSRIAHEVNADTTVESRCYVRQSYDGRLQVEITIHLRDIASQECILQVDGGDSYRSIGAAVEGIIDPLIRRWRQSLLIRASVQSRDGSKVQIDAGTNSGVSVGELFFVTRQIDSHPVKIGHLRAVTVAPGSAQAEVLNETMPISPHDVATRMYLDTFQRTPEQIRVSALVQATTRITLECTPCYGPCPIYKVILYRNGTVDYFGEEYVKRKGRFIGHISLWEFDRLAEVIEKLGFFQLDDHYAMRMTDASSNIVAVTRAGNEKTVSDYGSAGPAAFWGIATLIDHVVTHITDWKKDTAKKAKPHKPD